MLFRALNGYAESDGLTFDPAKILPDTEWCSYSSRKPLSFHPLYKAFCIRRKDCENDSLLALRETTIGESKQTSRKPTHQPSSWAQDGDHGSQDPKHEEHGHDVIAMKTMIMVLMPIESSVGWHGFIMTHGDHNHYFFKKDFDSRPQIKAAQDQSEKNHRTESSPWWWTR